MTDSAPCVTVVIPLYNKERCVRRAIDSVLAQTYTDFEVVVVNDGSTDDGPEIVRRIEDRRVCIVDQSNGGVSAARNRGINEARSVLVAFLDGDDEWLPDFLETVVKMARRHPEAGILATGYRLVRDTEDLWHDVTIGGHGVKHGCFFDIVRKGTEICSASSIAIRRHVFDRAGMFRVGYKLGEDLDMWFRAGLFYPLACSPKVCALYHYSQPDHTLRFSASKRVSPLYVSFLKVNKDMHMDPVLKAKALEYLSYQIRRDIEYVFSKGIHDVAMLRARLYRRQFGTDALYFKLWLLNMVPPAMLRMISAVRLVCRRRALKLRSSVRKWLGLRHAGSGRETSQASRLEVGREIAG